MPGPVRPRGPLPARVYWVRRLVLLAVVGLLVVGVARLLGVGGGPDPAAEAFNASGESSSTDGPAADEATSSSDGSATTGGPSDGSSTPTGPTPTGPTTASAPPSATPEPTRTPLARPTGPCDAEDVVVRPQVSGAVAGTRVLVELVLTTVDSPACVWEASSDSLVLKVTQGADDVWSTQHCPTSLAAKDVVVRKDHPVTVRLRWPGWVSSAGCVREEWSMPGDYAVEAAAFGGEPRRSSFSLAKPTPVTQQPDPAREEPSTTGTREPEEGGAESEEPGSRSSQQTGR